MRLQEESEGGRPVQKYRRTRWGALVILAGFVPVIMFMGKPTLIVPISKEKATIGCSPDSLDIGNQITPVVAWNQPAVTYAHIHVAKTGGTTVNGYLAAHFERVCGNKGYSYDAFQFNKRVNESGGYNINSAQGDLITKNFNHSNRGHLPNDDVATGIGFEDCDYISMEKPWGWWSNTFPNRDLEMHLPCRDPIDHILSQCNWRHQQFRCDIPPKSAIEECIVFMGRFRLNLKPTQKVKCFDFANFSGYLDYMGTKLQRKRVEATYIHRSTNRPAQDS